MASRFPLETLEHRAQLRRILLNETTNAEQWKKIARTICVLTVPVMTQKNVMKMYMCTFGQRFQNEYLSGNWRKLSSITLCKILTVVLWNFKFLSSTINGKYKDGNLDHWSKIISNQSGDFSFEKFIEKHNEL